MLFRSKRPFEEKKSLAVNEAMVVPAEEQKVSDQTKYEEQTDGQADGFDLVPAV